MFSKCMDHPSLPHSSRSQTKNIENVTAPEFLIRTARFFNVTSRKTSFFSISVKGPYVDTIPIVELNIFSDLSPPREEINQVIKKEKL